MHITKDKQSSLSISAIAKWILFPVSLAGSILLFYWSSLRYPFQFDDVANIIKFFSIRHVTFKDAFFAHTRWVSTWLNAINYRMGNFDSYYFRLFNVCIHTGTSILLFYVLHTGLTRLKKESFFKKNAFFISALTATFFALHPVQTQTVSYVIQGRLEGLAGLFCMGILAAFFAFSAIQHRVIHVIMGLFVCLLGAFACGTKEVMVISPFLLIITDWFFVAQGDQDSFLSRLWLHILFSLTVFGMYLYYLKPTFFMDIFGFKMQVNNNIGNMITENRTDKITPFHYFISEFKVILHYLWIFIWPAYISVDYDWMLVNNFFDTDCIVPFICLVAIAGYIVWLLRKNHADLVAFGLLWFFISIAPRASIIPSTEIMADYKTYLPSIGWLFVLATLVVWIVQKCITHYKDTNTLVYATLSIFALILGVATHQRNKVWRSGQDFWFNILQNAPGRARAHNNYGVALSEQGKYIEAIPYFKKAIKMDHLYPDPCNNLAVSYAALGKLDDAIEALKQSLRICPYYPESYNNLASFLINKKEYQSAENCLNIALQMRPHYGKAHYNLGHLYVARSAQVTDEKERVQFLEKAFQSYKDACTKADFDNEVIGFREYAKLSLLLKKYDEAIVALHKVLTFCPGDIDACFNLGNAYFLTNNFIQARNMFVTILKQNPQEARCWNNLGETLFRLGHFNEAIDCLQKAVGLNAQFYACDLRIADCYVRLNKKDDARTTLKKLLTKHVPDNIKTVAHNALIQLDKKA